MTRAAAWRAGAVLAALLLLWRILAVNAVLVDEQGRNRIPEGGSANALQALVRANPAEYAALLALAADDAGAGRAEQAAARLEAAISVAPIERATLAQSAQFHLRRGDMAAAAARLDSLATLYGDHERVFPVMARLLEARDPAWEAVAARNPPWLGAFVVSQCRRGMDPGLLIAALQRRVASGRQTPPEVECVTEKLRAAGRWEEAYQVWLNTLPRARLADVGYVFNGGFEEPASGLGFDWMPARGAERETGHAVEFAPAHGVEGKRALRVSYNGKRQAAPAIRQLMAVPPGRYELAGLGRVEGLNSVRGVQWTIRCAAGDRVALLGSSERFLGSSEWRRFAFEVAIPADCPGQALQLEPVGLNEGTTYVAGSVWFDDLRLARRR